MTNEKKDIVPVGTKITQIKDLAGIEDNVRKSIMDKKIAAAEKMVETSIARVEKAKAILKSLEEQHLELMEVNLSDVEIDDMEY